MRLPLVILLVGVLRPLSAGGAEQHWQSLLASMFSGPEAAELTAANIRKHFAPLVLIENYSRDRCAPVLKAVRGSELPVAASFVGTTLHRPCDQAGRVVILKLQIREKPGDLVSDLGALKDALLAANGAPCFDAAENGAPATYWSNPQRVLLITGSIDEGVGLTLSYFSRGAVWPPKDAGDTQVYNVWNSTVPAACQTP